jgi:hypothetical protein
VPGKRIIEWYGPLIAFIAFVAIAIWAEAWF